MVDGDNTNNMIYATAARCVVAAAAEMDQMGQQLLTATEQYGDNPADWPAAVRGDLPIIYRAIARAAETASTKIFALQTHSYEGLPRTSRLVAYFQQLQQAQPGTEKFGEAAVQLVGIAIREMAALERQL